MFNLPSPKARIDLLLLPLLYMTSKFAVKARSGLSILFTGNSRLIYRRLGIVGCLLLLLISFQASAQAQCPPGAINLTATATDYGQITLSWNNAAGITSYYDLYKSTTGLTGSFTYVNSYTRTSGGTVINGLDTNVTYYYYIHASGCSQDVYSNTASAKTWDIPSPTLTATATDYGQITLSWNVVPYLSKPYDLYKSSTGAPGSFSFVNSYATGTGSGGTVINGLDTNVPYYFYIVATSGSAVHNSNIASATTPDISNPVLSWKWTGNQQGILTWKAVPGAYSYAIYKAVDNPNSGFTLQQYFFSAPDGQTFTTTNIILSPNYTYYFYVTASRDSSTHKSNTVTVPIFNGNPLPDCGCHGDGPAAPKDRPAVPASSSGPSAPDPVNLATGRESYTPDPDITVYNPNGPSVTWQRSYYGYQALNGYGSPGLARGWVHNYDISIQGPATSGTWGALTLKYPNGATDTLTPQLDVNGQPTGAFTTPVGSEYIVSGVPSSAAGNWQSINITWKDQTKWTFTPPPIPPSAGDTVWVEDQLPSGATATSDGGDTWTWVGASPPPFSGSSAHQSVIATGEHQHYFTGATTTLQIGAGDTLVAYVYLDPANLPSEIMLQWNDGTSWEHRAYWGANNLTAWGTDGTASRHSMGPLPAAGQWVRLEVAASVVGLQGSTLTGMAFTLYGGRATWDHAGKTNAAAQAAVPVSSYGLTQITDRTGQSLNLSWDTNGKLTQISDATAGTALLTLAYDSNGHLSTATDAYNRQVTYTFQVQSSTDPGTLQSVSQVVTAGTSNPPAHWTYAYTTGSGQQLNTITVPSPTGTGTSTATINYDASGKVTSLVDANGNQRVYTYNVGNTLVQVKDSLNNIVLSWTQNYDANRHDSGFTDAANHSTSIVYGDAQNTLQPTQVTDRNGKVTTYTYDQYGNVKTITTPRNVTTTYTYDYTAFALGRLSSVQEGSKPATTFTYFEPSGLVKTVTSPAPAGSGVTTVTTSYTYDTLGNVLTVIDPGNNAAIQITTTYNYTTDGAYSQPAKIGQVLAITDNLGHVTHLRYDAQGRATSATDALGYETDASYNLVGQPDTITLPATGQTGAGRAHIVNSYLYTGGPLTASTAYDESSVQVRQVSHTYGLEGEPLSITGSTELATNTYDALYRLKTLKDGNNNTTTYAYNTVGFLLSVTMPGGQVIQYPSYDPNGNVLQRIDGNSVTTNYLYTDPESLLTDIQYPATTNLNVHFGYDTYGRRSSMSDSTGSQSYTYGSLDELQSVTTTYTGLPAQTISYGYYQNGTRQSMTTPAGNFTYNYDGAGRMSSLTNPFSETTSWAYFDNNWMQTQTLSNGATTNYTYNAQGQLTRLLNQKGVTTLSDFGSITYDGIGNRTSVTATLPAAPTLSGVTSYQYDTKNQLGQEQSTRNGGYTFGFGYDAAGNPTNFKGITKSYNTNNQQTGTGFVYDSNGNPTSYGGTSLSFDVENRLTAYSNVLTAGYTGDGLRAWKQTASSRTYFLYDGTAPVLEINASGTVTGTTTYGANGLVSRRTGTTNVFYTFDVQGSVSQWLDGSGNILSTNLYSAHGTPISTVTTNPYGYHGQWGYYTDVETGLILCTYRYYDPSTGRFLTRDPISYNGGINLYAHVGNNPANTTDSFGLYPDGDDDPGFISLYGSYLTGVGKGFVGAVAGTVTLPIHLIAHPVDTVSGIADDLAMRAQTMYQVVRHPSDAKEAITDAIIELGPNKAMEILGDAGGQVIAYKVMVRVGKDIKRGHEWEINKKCRIAPYGNRTGHPTGRFPHYHRARPNPKRPGHSLPGQSDKRHRPWDKRPQDKSWLDRF